MFEHAYSTDAVKVESLEYRFENVFSAQDRLDWLKNHPEERTAPNGTANPYFDSTASSFVRK
jgi:hypothetical protein